ncbi:hypothetical protein ACFLRA_02725 [Bdellovibrionota bacterium]
MAKKSKRKRTRKQFVVLREFQLRFSLLLAILGLLVTLVVGIIIYGVYDSNINILADKVDVTSPAVIDFLSSMRKDIFQSLVAVFVGVTAILMLLGIFMSHKMAGPVFALLRQMKLLSHGDFNATLLLRKGDEFQNLREGYNELVTSLQNRIKEDILRITRIRQDLGDRIDSLSKIGAPPTQVEELRALKDSLDLMYDEKNNLLNPREEKFTIDDVVI